MADNSNSKDAPISIPKGGGAIKGIGETFQLLLKEIELCGPIMNKWPNYGKLFKNCYHCHLKKGKPTYVAVWRVVSKKEKIVEVVYVGTHEKAPY